MVRAVAAALALSVLAVVAVAPPAGASPPSDGAYRPPVDAPIIDPFRPPLTQYGAGNRGIDFATPEGDPVRASASGTVVFAGPVAGTLHVVVLHADGLRTSYSFLASRAVRRGERVEAGTIVGTAGAVLHFGVRAGDAYLDPAALFGDGVRLRLVPVDRRPQVDRARRALVDRFYARGGRSGLGALRAAVGWARRGATATASALKNGAGDAVAYVRSEVASLGDELRTWAHYVKELQVQPHVVRLGVAAVRWMRQRDRCTPRATAPPPPATRRIVVLVAGLGSSSENAAVNRLDTASLGYAADDVVRFSYAGGDSPYDQRDSQGDLTVAAARLADLLREVRRRAPGVPVDVVGHSQGGVVARLALDVEPPASGGQRPLLVTLGAPHAGADLATGVGQLERTTVGQLALAAGSALAPGPDSSSPAIAQLSETSSLIRRLQRRGPPDGVDMVSIAARGDLVVPAGRSRIGGATNVVVGLSGLTAHDRLPSSAAARREIALALGGMPPTCESLGEALLDAAVPDAIGWSEDRLGAALGLGARRLDGGLGGKGPPRTRTPGQPRPAGR